MNSRTTLLLLLLLVLLGAVAFWQLEREEQGVFENDRALFPGLVPAHIRSVRIDSLERGLEMRIVLDEDKTWRIIDPVDYPAERARMNNLFSIVTSNRAIETTHADLNALHLSPPRAIVEITEERPSGEYVHRLELGSQALDHNQVFVRVGGQVYLTSANLDTALDHDVFAWRRQAITGISPQLVEEIHRTGSIQLPGSEESFDLTFSASIEGPGLWRSMKPFRATLDLVAFGGMLGRTCTMRAHSFVSDAVTDPAVHGMDQPDVRVELITNQGAREVLLFKRRPGRETWLCMLEGGAHLYAVRNEDALIVATPAEVLIERQLVHVVRDSIERVRLVSGGGEVVLTRRRSNWRVSEQRGGAESREAQPADADRVAELLGAIDAARFARMELGMEFQAGFVPEGIYVEANGVTFGGAIGIPHTTSEGVETVQLLRAGDEVVGLIEPEVAELARTPFEELLDRRLLKLSELAIVRLELTGAGNEREYVRDSKSGLWMPDGVDTEAVELLEWIEGILSITADEIVPAQGEYDLQQPVAVLITDGGGVEYAYTLGRGGAAGQRPDATIYVGAERTAVLPDGLHAGLWELLSAGP